MKTEPEYVSPRTRRRRKGRAIRKARREARQRFAVLSEGLILAVGAFATVSAGIGAVGSAALVATMRLRAIEDAAAMFHADVLAQSFTHEGVER